MDASLYKVLYEDGDEEEMYHNELKSHLKPTKKAKHRRSKPLNRIISKFAPNELDEDHHTLELNANTNRAIASIKYGDQITHSDVSDELIRLYTLGSDSVTPEEAQLGHFTRRKLKKLTTWPLWLAGETKQLDQFAIQKMFGDPIDASTLSSDSILLRAHWNYTVKRDGTRRSRLCGDGSKRSAPMLHSIAATWSSCVELPIQRLFLGLCATNNLKNYGADVVDAYSHSPAESVTYLRVDDAYTDWYYSWFGKRIDRSKVLPIRNSLQGIPTSGRNWMKVIDRVLKELG